MNTSRGNSSRSFRRCFGTFRKTFQAYALKTHAASTIVSAAMRNKSASSRGRGCSIFCRCYGAPPRGGRWRWQTGQKPGQETGITFFASRNTSGKQGVVSCFRSLTLVVNWFLARDFSAKFPTGNWFESSNVRSENPNLPKVCLMSKFPESSSRIRTVKPVR